MSDEYIELDLEIIAMTRDAVLFSDSTQEQWVPRSTILDGNDLEYDQIGETLTVEIQEWMAVDRGLV